MLGAQEFPAGAACAVPNARTTNQGPWRSAEPVLAWRHPLDCSGDVVRGHLQEVIRSTTAPIYRTCSVTAVADGVADDAADVGDLAHGVQGRAARRAFPVLPLKITGVLNQLQVMPTMIMLHS